jgi:LuxR family maltose regulon positive regulatory protein
LLHITLARFFLAQGEPERALTLLEHTSSKAEPLRRWGSVIEVLALAALAYRALDDRSQALDTLDRALTLARPENYVRLFVDQGEPMARLLSEFLKQSGAPEQEASRDLAEYVGALLGAFDPAIWQTAGTGAARQRPPQPLLEPLSERELEVLQLLSGGLSNREIASRLFLTVGTIKWHLHNIYGKLGVHSRVQAVTRANELDLLS